jgi:hypothetical protein
MFSRIHPSFLKNDGSIQNRLKLWQDGVVICASKPLFGWGGNQAGPIYSQWFQRIDTDGAYNGLVNSYLTFAAEHGVMALGCVVGAMTFIVLTAAKTASEGSVIATAYSSIIITWMIVSFWSDLWTNPILWIIPGATAILVIREAQSHLSRLVVLLYLKIGMIMALASASILLGYGICSKHNREVQLQGTNKEYQLSWVNESVGTKCILFMTDPRVLGEWPGREIRKILPNLRQFSSIKVTLDSLLEVHTNDRPLTLVALGRCLPEIANMPAFSKVILVCPEANPEYVEQLELIAKNTINGTVVIPRIDQDGTNEYWIQWSHSHGWRLISSISTGRDIRSEWGSLISDAI